MVLFWTANLFCNLPCNYNNGRDILLLSISYFRTSLYQDIPLNYIHDSLCFQNTNSRQVHILQFLIPVS